MGPIAIVGYAQHPDYWRDGLQPVIDAIVRRRQESDGMQRASDLPVIHLRRGDYVTLGWDLGVDHYRTGLRRLAEDGVDLSRGVRIVADDELAAAGVAEILGREGWRAFVDQRPPEWVRGAQPIQDFWTIADAPAVVMSNSTFCWWATVAGDEIHGHRPVAYPAGWIGDGPDLLRLESWIPTRSQES